MLRLRAVGRFVAFGLWSSRSDSGRQGEGVKQKEYGEFLQLLGAWFIETFTVRCLVAFVTNDVRPLFHRRGDCVLLGKSVNALAKLLLAEVLPIRLQFQGGPLQDPAEHKARTRPLSAPQAVHCLLVIPRHRRGDVLGCADLQKFRVYLKHLETFIARVTVAVAWARNTPTYPTQFDDHTLSTFTAHQERIPDVITCFNMFAVTYEHEPYSLGRAVGAV